MKELNLFEKIIDWLFTPKYNCEKGKHRWGYKLDDVGVVYLDDKQVPKDKWICLDCGVNKELFEIGELMCPACGYYCIGHGGIGCIDKKTLFESKQKHHD